MRALLPLARTTLDQLAKLRDLEVTLPCARVTRIQVLCITRTLEAIMARDRRRHLCPNYHRGQLRDLSLRMLQKCITMIGLNLTRVHRPSLRCMLCSSGSLQQPRARLTRSYVKVWYDSSGIV